MKIYEKVSVIQVGESYFYRFVSQGSFECSKLPENAELFLGEGASDAVEKVCDRLRSLKVSPVILTWYSELEVKWIDCPFASHSAGMASIAGRVEPEGLSDAWLVHLEFDDSSRRTIFYEKEEAAVVAAKSNEMVGKAGKFLNVLTGRFVVEIPTIEKIQIRRS